MDFLLCNPSVCVVENDYQILVATKDFGTIAIKVGDEYFYEDNSGVLASQKNNFKIIVPISKLDSAKKYSVVYRKVIERKKYFSVVEDIVEKEFAFKPVKENDINAYHLADIHKRFDLAKEAVSYFGKDLDLLIINGDICEVETDGDFFEVLTFLGEISGGVIPIVFSRGNHDTRGKLAERFTDYFPSVNRNTFYNFNVGPIGGIVLDCGEDKVESNVVYADLNRFDSYRRKQKEFLVNHNKTDKKFFFGLCHIPPCKTTKNIGDEFDIEKDIYTAWCSELERIGAKFILSGHLHKTFIVEKDDESKTCPCNIPLIVGSALDRANNFMCGTAINFNGDTITIKFTDNNKQELNKYIIKV